MELNGSYNLSLINPEKDKQYVNAGGKGKNKPINKKKEVKKENRKDREEKKGR